jgi:cobalt/nickel transport system permease protein
MLAALLIRSYERAERVYAAMLSRGFSSEAPALRVLHFKGVDFLFVSASFLILLGIGVLRP